MVNLLKQLFPSPAPATPSKEPDVIILHRQATGTSGAKNFSGYPQEEYLQSHQGIQRADLYDKMRRGDYIIQMCLGAVTNPLVAANWEVEKYCDPRIEAKKKILEQKKKDLMAKQFEPSLISVKDNPQDVEAKKETELKKLAEEIEKTEADIETLEAESKANGTDEWAEQDAKLIEYILFEKMDKTWEQYLIEALVIMVYGHSVFEMVDKLPENHPIHGIVHALNLKFISPRTIDRWNIDRKTEKIASITQQAHGDLNSNVDIEGQFLQVLSFRREGANYEGISPLRGAYGPWYRKQEYAKLNAIGIEKFAIPAPLAKIPAGKQNTPDYQNLISILQNWVNHEKQYITYPEGYEITLHSNAYDPEKVENSIDKEDSRIVKAFLANFLNLDTAGSGSYALSNDLSDFFLGGLEFIAKIICNSFNRDVIPRLVQINRGPRDGYPKLKASGISDKLGEEFAKMIDIMVGKKVIQPDDKLEQHVRRRMGLPEASPEGRRSLDPVVATGQVDPKTGMPMDPKDPKEGGKPPGAKPIPPVKPDEEESTVEKLAELIRNRRKL